jgi:hypothetical protein
VKNQKSYKSGPKKFIEDFNNFECVKGESKAKKPKRVRRENFDDENDNLDSYDVYSD